MSHGVIRTPRSSAFQGHQVGNVLSYRWTVQLIDPRIFSSTVVSLVPIYSTIVRHPPRTFGRDFLHLREQGV